MLNEHILLVIDKTAALEKIYISYKIFCHPISFEIYMPILKITNSGLDCITGKMNLHFHYHAQNTSKDIHPWFTSPWFTSAENTVIGQWKNFTLVTFSWKFDNKIMLSL